MTAAAAFEPWRRAGGGVVPTEHPRLRFHALCGAGCRVSVELSASHTTCTLCSPSTSLACFTRASFVHYSADVVLAMVSCVRMQRKITR